MPSVFAGGQTYAGGFRADQLDLSFGGDPVKGFLVQNVQFSYTQQITLLYEIGSSYVYYVGGRAQGTATLARVIGPAPFSGKFINMFNDLCKPQDINFNAKSGCKQGDGLSYTIEDAVLVTVSASVTSQQVVINEQLQFIFIDLEI